MVLTDVIPSPILREYVSKHQIVRFKFGAEVIVPIKAYWPRPEQYIVFYFRDLMNVSPFLSQKQERQTYPKCAIVGQSSQVVNRHVTHDFWCLQIVMQPGALFRLTGIPCYELTNTYIDGEALWNPEIRSVHEQISNCDNEFESIKIAENFLEKIVKKAKYDLVGIDKVGQIILNNCLGHRPETVDYFANQSCLSTRQFRRKFIERNGISPKSFDRVNRFDRAIRMKNKFTHKDWLTIALELGYHDYQHLVRDFKEFTTLTPNGFLVAEGKSPERTFGVVEV